MTAQEDRLAIASIASEISRHDRGFTERADLTAELIDIYNRATDRQYKLTEFVREIAYSDQYFGFTKTPDDRIEQYARRARYLLSLPEEEEDQAADDAQLSRIESSACDR